MPSSAMTGSTASRSPPRTPPAGPHRSPLTGSERWGHRGHRPPEPTVVDGEVLLQATLTDAADSDAAAATVRDVRSVLTPLGARVGGVTATSIDTNDASIHDRTLIIPVILIVIMLILTLLLRSILAPVLLILTTVLSFGTALGVSALVLNGLFRFPVRTRRCRSTDSSSSSPWGSTTTSS